MSSRDHWRITTAAIQLEMERISGLLEKSIHFHSRTSTAHSIRKRGRPTSRKEVSVHDTERATEFVP